MGPRTRRIAGEAAKFSAVNVVATAVAIALFNVLVHGIPGLLRPGPMNDRPLSGWFLANCVGMLISFYGSRGYAFKHRQPTGPAGGALMYVVINLVSFVIPISCLWFTRDVLGWSSALADNVAGNVVGAALGMLFRFWAFRRYVFRRDGGAHLEPALLQSSPLAPELGPREAELLEHQPEQWQADADDVVRVAGHARDERAPESVQGESTGHR